MWPRKTQGVHHYSLLGACKVTHHTTKPHTHWDDSVHKSENPVHYCWEYKMAKLLGKTVWPSLRKSAIELLYDLPVSILCQGIESRVSQWKEKYGLRTPRPSFQHKGGLFAPERQRAGHKSQRREIEDKREVERNKRWGKRIFVQEGQRAASE